MNYTNFILSYCICYKNWRGFLQWDSRCGKLVVSTTTCCLMLKVIQLVQTKPFPLVFYTDAACGWTHSLRPFKLWSILIIWSWFSSSSGRVRNRGLFRERLVSQGNDMGAFLSWSCGANNQSKPAAHFLCVHFPPLWIATGVVSFTNSFI